MQALLRRHRLLCGVLGLGLPLLSAAYIGGQFYTSVPSGQFLWRYALPGLPFVALAAAISVMALRERVALTRARG